MSVSGFFNFLKLFKQKLISKEIVHVSSHNCDMCQY